MNSTKCAAVYREGRGKRDEKVRIVHSRVGTYNDINLNFLLFKMCVKIKYKRMKKPSKRFQISTLKIYKNDTYYIIRLRGNYRYHLDV